MFPCPHISCDETQYLVGKLPVLWSEEILKKIRVGVRVRVRV